MTSREKFGAPTKLESAPPVRSLITKATAWEWEDTDSSPAGRPNLNKISSFRSNYNQILPVCPSDFGLISLISRSRSNNSWTSGTKILGVLILISGQLSCLFLLRSLLRRCGLELSIFYRKFPEEHILLEEFRLRFQS